MAGNRKLPFGYQMEQGRVVIHPKEAPIVREIFQEYILGASYKALVDGLREQGVVYNQGKTWNKNMVARILENKRYIGLSGWPSIITEEQYNRADEKRSGKVILPQRIKAQKVLRKLSGSNVSELIEQQVCNMMNALIKNPYQIYVQQRRAPDRMQNTELSLAWERELNRQPVDEAVARQLAMAVAAQEYEAITNQEYETEHLRRIFQKQKPMRELDADLLRSAVAKIQVRDQKLMIHLKNGQILERIS